MPAAPTKPLPSPTPQTPTNPHEIDGDRGTRGAVITINFRRGRVGCRLASTAARVTDYRTVLHDLACLNAHDNFALCGIAGLGADGCRKTVHVHAKLMIVDDSWATVGSCNLHRFSLFGNGELNVAFHDPATVRALRVELYGEHLGIDTSGMDGREAICLFRRIAETNRALHAGGDPDWQGLAFRLDAPTHG